MMAMMYIVMILSSLDIYVAVDRWCMHNKESISDLHDQSNVRDMIELELISVIIGFRGLLWQIRQKSLICTHHDSWIIRAHFRCKGIPQRTIQPDSVTQGVKNYPQYVAIW